MAYRDNYGYRGIVGGAEGSSVVFTTATLEHHAVSALFESFLSLILHANRCETVHGKDSLADTNTRDIELKSDVRSDSEATSVENSISIHEQALRLHLWLVSHQSIKKLFVRGNFLES